MTERNYPEVCVGALIFNQNKEVFLMKSHKFKDKYVIPGGHIEFGEKIEDALKREILEEAGLEISDIKFISLQECVFDDKVFYKPNRHFIFIDYICKTDSTDVELNDEGQSYVWVKVNEALKLDVEPYTAYVIKEYLKSC